MADPGRQTSTDATSGTPTVVVQHLSVTYEVLGGERRGVPETSEQPGFLTRMLRPATAERVKEVRAVKDVSFVARHGESIGIIGRNGSGKSTLLRAIAGLVPPSGGRLWAAGEPSLLGVNAVLINKLSGRRNVYVGGQAMGLSIREIDEKFDDIVEFSGIGEAIDLPMSTYSSGMGARLRFAISTAASPEVLMIDEALATGDAAFRHKSAERIAEIRQRAGTVFLVSHSSSNIREICDRVLWMDKGHLIMDGPTAEVLPAYEASLPQSKAPQASGRAEEPDVPGTVRWTGSNRFQVTCAATRSTWDPGVEGCFLVDTRRLSTARMVAPVAARLGWPIVWTENSALRPTPRDELARLAPERTVIVGGEDQIKPKLISQVEALTPGTVERVGDEDPALTAAQLLAAYPPDDTSTVYLTQRSGTEPTLLVSLEAAVTGRAVAVCGTQELPDRLIDALHGLRPRRLVLVGHEEDWSTEVLRQLHEVSDAEVEMSTAGGPMTMAAGLWDDIAPGGQVIVTGSDGVALMTATVAAGHTETPLLLVRPGPLADVVRSTLERLQPHQVVLCGSKEALPRSLRAELGEIVSAGTR